MTEMTAGELFRAGKLREAIAAATEAVKKAPRDTSKRAFLAQMLCFNGEWDRADKYLETVVDQEPQTAVGASLVRQLIRAEVARHQCFNEGRVPEFLGTPSPLVQLHLKAAIALREGRCGEAATLLQEAEAQRVKPQGTCDGTPFDDFRDVDDLVSSFFEVCTSTGKYYWVSMDQVTSIDFHKPERPHDLIWRHARLGFRDAAEGEAYIPVLYPLTLTQNDEDLRMGHATRWQDENDTPVRGLGQRLYLVGEEAKSILEMEHLEFTVAPAGDQAS